MLNKNGLWPLSSWLRLWHVWVLALALLCGFSYVNSFMTTRANLVLQCQAHVYQSPFNAAALPSAVPLLKLNVLFEEGEFTMEYHYELEGNSISSATLAGSVADFDVGSMTYKLQLNTATLNNDKPMVQGDDPVQTLLKGLQSRLDEQGDLPLEMQVLEYDDDKHFALIKFMPTANLWACHHQ